MAVAAERARLIGITVALMLVSLPHALEDFHYGDLMRLGVGPSAGAAILATMYAAQLAGIAWTARGSRIGLAVLGLAGTIWCVGAIAIHGRDLLYGGPDYRHGLISKLLEVLIILFGALTAWLSLRAARTGA